MYMYVHALPSAPGFSLCVEFVFVHKGRERVWCCEDKYGTSLTNFLAVNVQHSICVCILFLFIAL